MKQLAAKSLVERIDEEIEKQSLLKHPFYQMWSEGKLSKEDLAGYAREYFQLVRTIPSLVENIIALSEDGEVAYFENLEDEKRHITLWERFAFSLGIPAKAINEYFGTEKTRAAVSKLGDLTTLSFEEAIAAMYAYEKEIPRISRSKIDGLKKFYDMDSEDATAYFLTHERDDIRHAAVWRNVLSKIPKADQEKAFNAAVESLTAQNLLLDSVMERYVRAN
jgi:pyrroloquinoline-quinone synthase